jgi:regulator of protease activity HflC (stomatin/prohibitin superfamily)
MRSFKNIVLSIFAGVAILLAGCGTRVEVPPAHVGKIMTKDGYQEALVPTSKFRLPLCWAYCDRLVLLNVSDQAFIENLDIFIPKDKLQLGVQVRTTLSINTSKTDKLFGSISPEPTEDESLSSIDSKKIYTTYAQQIIQAESQEYLSQYSINEIASSIEKVNADLRVKLTKSLQERTPFDVRNVGVTDVKYPTIITEAQTGAARRREQIQQEEAQLEISKVQLDRDLQEARLKRQIEKEVADTAAAATLIKAKAEADAIELKGRAEAEAIEARGKALAGNPLLVQLTWAQAWKGRYPTELTVLGGDSGSPAPIWHLNSQGK